jgi:hypothetical protein
MHRGADYCRSKAVEYERRAQEATDEIIRRFLYWMRDNWMIAAEVLRSRGARISRKVYAVHSRAICAPTGRNAAQYFCYDGFGHDASLPGALWQVPARSCETSGSGRLRVTSVADQIEIGSIVRLKSGGPQYDGGGHFLRS